MPILTFSRCCLATAVLAVSAGISIAADAGDKPSPNAPPKPSAEAKPAPDKTPTRPEDIRQNAPTFLVRADVNHRTRTYRQGDTLSIQVNSEEDAYLYVLYKQADGKVFQIFPNSKQPDNRVKARQAVEVPAADDLFRWVVGPPFGEEVIKVFAAKEPLGELSDPALREKFFNPVGPQMLKGIGVTLGKASRPWAEDYVRLVTYSADDRLGNPAGRRLAVLIGVGQYEFAEDILTGWKMPPPPLAGQVPYHRDARRLGELLREVGQLSDYRVCTNQQATRDRIEEILTGWLPSVSRPGDTVFIFFGGFSENLAKWGAPDEAALYCYDIIPPLALANLIKKQKEGKLPPYVAHRLDSLGKAFAKLPNNDDNLLMRAAYYATGIPNRVFAHWLQGLAGRQIVLVLDTMSSSHFVAGAGAASSKPSSSPPGTKDLPAIGLAPEVKRLENLGQSEIALLAAAGPSETSLPLDMPGDSPFAAALMTVLKSEPGPLTLETAHARCGKLMEEFQEKLNRQRESQGLKPLPVQRPCIVNYSKQPVVLKP